MKKYNVTLTIKVKNTKDIIEQLKEQIIKGNYKFDSLEDCKEK